MNKLIFPKLYHNFNLWTFFFHIKYLKHHLLLIKMKDNYFLIIMRYPLIYLIYCHIFHRRSISTTENQIFTVNLSNIYHFLHCKTICLGCVSLCNLFISLLKINQIYGGLQINPPMHFFCWRNQRRKIRFLYFCRLFLISPSLSA